MSERTIGDHLEYATNAAQYEAYQHDGEEFPLEVMPESLSAVDFTTFAIDYPEKLLPLLEQLRPEFQELFMEYHLLHKFQSFLGKTHGCIQTRIWQALRVIEHAIGALLVLGPTPGFIDMQNALATAGLDHIEFGKVVGSLAGLIAQYAETRDYAAVAQSVHAPIPAIRKVFRPAIKTLSASHNLKVAAIGAYLRSLTHQSALQEKGLSKRALNRLNRSKVHYFVAPPRDESPLINYGTTHELGGRPWSMFEASWDGENNLASIRAAIQKNAGKLFGKKAAQVFMPFDAEGRLLYGYVFARGLGSVRGLLRISGISSISTQYHEYDDSSSSEVPDARAVQIPHADVAMLIMKHPATVPVFDGIKRGAFVRILTGEAAQYCGVVTAVYKTSVRVEVKFPTGRRFIVSAHLSSVKPLDAEPSRQTFWGVKPS